MVKPNNILKESLANSIFYSKVLHCRLPPSMGIPEAFQALHLYKQHRERLLKQLHGILLLMLFMEFQIKQTQFARKNILLPKACKFTVGAPKLQLCSFLLANRFQGTYTEIEH